MLLTFLGDIKVSFFSHNLKFSLNRRSSYGTKYPCMIVLLGVAYHKKRNKNEASIVYQRVCSQVRLTNLSPF